MDALFAAIPAAAGASFLVVREAWRAWQPARLLIAGRYVDARTSAEALAASWMRVLPGVRFSTTYAIACALHFEGDLDGSLKTTAGITRDGLSRSARYDVDSLDAASLVLRDHDGDRDRARELLRSATKIQRLPEDRLLELLANPDAGDPVPTDKVAGERGAIVSFLRGLYFLRRGDAARAKADLQAAANAAHANIYTRRARALLAERPVDEGPSSLAPQVVAASATAREGGT